MYKFDNKMDLGWLYSSDYTNVWMDEVLQGFFHDTSSYWGTILGMGGGGWDYPLSNTVNYCQAQGPSRHLHLFQVCTQKPSTSAELPVGRHVTPLLCFCVLEMCTYRDLLCH